MAGSGYGLDEDFGDSSDEDDEKEKKKKQEEEQKKKMEEELENEKNNVNLDNYMDSYLGIYKKGTYVKMDLKLKYKHFRQFSPEHPLVLCRINPGEGKNPSITLTKIIKNSLKITKIRHFWVRKG